MTDAEHNVIVININSATMLDSLLGVVAAETILVHNISYYVPTNESRVLSAPPCTVTLSSARYDN